MSLNFMNTSKTKLMCTLSLSKLPTYYLYIVFLFIDYAQVENFLIASLRKSSSAKRWPREFSSKSYKPSITATVTILSTVT